MTRRTLREIIDANINAPIAPKRKAISKRIRFEVFKRDKFACQYCGKTAPDVILVIDHVHPVSKGGENSLLNLLTACESCNSGKGDKTLSDESLLSKQREQMRLLAVRREQITMLLEYQTFLDESTGQEVAAFAQRYRQLLPFSLNERGLDTARKWLRKFTLVELMKAAEISVSQYFKKDSEGKPIFESAEKAFNMIPGIARLSKLPQSERDIYYIRGIVRQRVGCPDQVYAIQKIREAVASGADIGELKEVARSARSWSSWCNTMDAYISDDREVSK